MILAGTHVAVAGRVVRLRLTADGGWRVRLADTGGALAAAEFRPDRAIPLPSIGAWVVVHGPLRYDSQHRWYVVDPVEEWAPIQPFSRLA
jgi:hypothetical protein